jgi:hypothetical protein
VASTQGNETDEQVANRVVNLRLDDYETYRQEIDGPQEGQAGFAPPAQSDSTK